MDFDVREELVKEIALWQERLEFNRNMAKLINRDAHEYYVIARVQQAVVYRLQRMLSLIDEANTIHPDQESAMNTVKSLAGTGTPYCQFQIEVAGGSWGEAPSVSLIETVSNGGCGGGTSTKRTKLSKFELPIAGIPAGTYTLQAKRTGGGCGEAKGAHVQFKFPANAPSSVTSKGNRAYGWAFETNSPELIARLG